MTHKDAPPWLILTTGLLVTMVAIVFARLAYGLVLPGMRAALGLGYGQAANLASASALGYLLLVLVAGALAARRGARFSITLGISLITCGFAGVALSSDYRALMLFMVLLGVGTAFSYTPLVSLIAGRFPQRRGFVIGLMSSGVGLGMLLVGVMVPRLDMFFGSDGWRWNWAVFGLVGLVCLGAVKAFLPTTAVHPHAAPTLFSSGGGPTVFRNRRVTTVGVLYGITGVIYMVQATFMYSFTLDVGIAPATAGGLAAAMGVLSIPVGPLWGTLSDRIGRGRGILVTMIAAFVATLVPVIFPSFWGFAFHYVVLGLTIAGLFTNILAAASEEVEFHQAAVAVSYVTFFFAAGQLAGPFFGGLIVDGGGSFRVVFAVCSLLILAGVVLAFRFQRSGRCSTQ